MFLIGKKLNLIKLFIVIQVIQGLIKDQGKHLLKTGFRVYCILCFEWIPTIFLVVHGLFNFRTGNIVATRVPTKPALHLKTRIVYFV